MSVVNKMLRDLENRQATAQTLSADYQPPVSRKKWRWLALLALLVVALLGWYAYQPQGSTSTTQSDETSRPAAKKMLVAKPAELANDDLVQAASARSQLAPADTTTPPSHNSAVTGLAQSTAPEPAEQATPQTVAQTAAQLQAEAAPPLEFVEPALQSAPEAFSGRQESLPVQAAAQPQAMDKEAVEAPQDAESRESESRESGSRESGPSEAGSFTKHSSSAQSQSQDLRQQIGDALAAKDDSRAIQLLTQLVSREPDNADAVKTLSSLLFANGDAARAAQLLQQTLQRLPQRSDLTLMLARLSAQQNNPGLALQLLRESQPAAYIEIEYLAYRASLAQQAGDTVLAKQDYLALTQIDAGNAKWWLGLGISEDKLQATAAARMAYEKAKSLQQLAPEVTGFIDQRLTMMVNNP